VDDIKDINGYFLSNMRMMFMNTSSKYTKWYALPLYLFLTLPSMLNADIGIVAIAVDANLQDKGAFEANSGINVGDVISTGPSGNLTILFDDESMLTLGPNTTAEIVKYSETPAPGVSEIKIISGSFNYFPGMILENGGQQTLSNLADLGSRTTSTTRDPIDTSPIAAKTTTTIPTLNNEKENVTPTGGASLPIDTVNTAELAVTVTKPIINLVVASSGAADGANGGNTAISGVEQEQEAEAAPEPTITIDPAFHFDMNGVNLHRKDSPDNGHVPHS